MDEDNKLPKEPVTYATPIQRLWAWVGVVYMVGFVLMTTYALSHGRYLQGIGSLMVSPALAGLGGSAILRYRQGAGRGGLVACVLIAGGCFVLVGLNLMQGIPILIAQL